MDTPARGLAALLIIATIPFLGGRLVISFAGIDEMRSATVAVIAGRLLLFGDLYVLGPTTTGRSGPQNTKTEHERCRLDGGSRSHRAEFPGTSRSRIHDHRGTQTGLMTPRQRRDAFPC